MAGREFSWAHPRRIPFSFFFFFFGLQPGGDPNLWNDRSDAREDTYVCISVPANGGEGSESLLGLTRFTLLFISGVQPGCDPRLRDRFDAREDAYMYMYVPANSNEGSEGPLRFTRFTFSFRL